MFFKKIDVSEFQFDIPTNSPTNEGGISDEPDNPTLVAQITFDCLKPGDLIWLNSIFHVNNDNVFDITVFHSILKNNIPIYSAVTEVDREGNDDFGQIFSQQYVDVVTTLEKNIIYQVVASIEGHANIDSSFPNVNLVGPITFTGTRFVKGKKWV
ncbi:hypothetical protein VQL36_11080 [Chengkuizengella sp. SCS-71B]|uniref:hypothetical protein n=1 Tax=Chengkuizengella sp. SCS-71B TaxID=3115290 RepID=UPI0032C23FB4